MPEQAYFAVLRWKPDLARDEPKNVAILLVEAEGAYGVWRQAPISRVASRVGDQGLLDQILAGVARRVEGGASIVEVDRMRRQLSGTLTMTEPQRTAIAGSPDDTAETLYKVLVRPPSGGSRGVTKGELLDRTIDQLRRQPGDLEVGRAVRAGDYLFDAEVRRGDAGKQVFLDVFSFANPRKTWNEVEYEAGHFIYALDRSDATGLAVVEPPRTDLSTETAFVTHDRIQKWFADATLPVCSVRQLAETDVFSLAGLP